MNPLYEAYIQGDPDVTALFSSAPEALFNKTAPTGAWKNGVVSAINRTQHYLGVSKAAVAGDELVVATGQQTGLFTGPLYTVYKAITAIKLAERFQALGTPCVPVFWAAGDDHDFEEVRNAHFLTKRSEILSQTYTPQNGDISDMPMYRVPLDKQIHAFIDAAATACRGGEYAAEIQGVLHETADAATSPADWFVRLMARLFADTRLLMLPSWDPAVRTAAASVIKREITHPLACTQLLIQQAEFLESLGYKALIRRRENACNFFVEQDDRRRNVLFKDNRFHIAGIRGALTPDEMLARLDHAPGLFSPNVALRPVVQQQLFPVVAYAAGPGEVAYWAQLKPLFDFYETPMPVVYPRIRCVINTIKTNQLLRRYGLSPAMIMNNDDLLARALQADADNAALKTFQRHRAIVADALEEMARDMKDESIAREAGRAAERFERNVLAELDKLERRLLYADTEKRRVIEARIGRLRAVIAPLNKPQERVISVFSFLFEHGRPLIKRMITELDAECFEIQEMEL
ncbi:MAG TPA: bacillithiol biosynthesis cysteine-adding enzyme BshC [Candidatus Hydrogenedentes bacterium]|nr:bacillithiol biosynthesis cysteine-adding enzyme BshC [Candidatus Hydrogenedentota bacterium]